MLEQFELQLLARNHQRAAFHCQSASLNEFLHKHAKGQHQNRTTRVYVFADRDGLIAGYFTLSSNALEVMGLPDSILKGRSRLPIPAILLGRFAIDRQYEGQGLGGVLLGYALREARKSSEIVAAAFVVLDIAEDASARASELYRRYGFVSLSSNPQRMVLPMDEISRRL